MCVELNPGPARRKRGQHISEEKKWEIVFYSKRLKKTPTQIAGLVRVDRHTVYQVLEKYGKTKSVHDLPRSGRKPILSAHEIKMTLKKAGQKKTAPQIRREIKTKASVSTIQRTLKKHGLFYGKVKKSQRLSELQRQKRVDYATEMNGFNYGTVLFTDEKTFQLGSGDEYCWQRIGNRPTREYVRHAPKLHVWAGIGSNMKTKLYFFQKNMNSDLYISILKKSLKETQITYAPNTPKKLKGNWIFLQDNSAIHKSKKSMKVVEELVGDRLIAHPPVSPDMNAIENMWSYLDRKVKAAQVTNISHLKRVLNKEWKNLPWSEIRKSVDSMPRRLEQCLELGGKRTEY